MKESTKKLFYATFVLIVLAIFGAMSFHFLKHGDFPQHIDWARELSENGYMYKIPHSLFHKLVVVVRALLPANLLVWVSVFAKQVYDLKAFEISTLILMTLTYLAIALILVKHLLREWGEWRSKKLIWWAGLGALVIMLVAPVFIFSLPRMYLGYPTGNRFDSPTYIMAKPFVLLVFINLVENLFKRWSWTKALWMAAFIMCATLAKPNFTITILPAMGIVLIAFYIKKWKKVNWLHVIFAFGLTAVIVLVGQFAINFYGDRGDRVIIAPFVAILGLVKDIPNLILFLVMGLLFPLAIVILYWRRAKLDLALQLAGVNFLVALTYGLILGEEINMSVANFWNCVQFGTFVLFFATIVFYGRIVIERWTSNQKLSWREWSGGALLAAHFICGVIYFVSAIIYGGIVKM